MGCGSSKALPLQPVSLKQGVRNNDPEQRTVNEKQVSIGRSSEDCLNSNRPTQNETSSFAVASADELAIHGKQLVPDEKRSSNIDAECKDQDSLAYTWTAFGKQRPPSEDSGDATEYNSDPDSIENGADAGELGASIRLDGDDAFDVSIGHRLAQRPGKLSVENCRNFDMEQFRKALAENDSVREIQLTACEVNVGQIEELFSIVEAHQMKKITIARSGLSDDSVAVISSILSSSQKCASLEILMLDGNAQIGDASAEHLSEMLCSNTTLKELSLWATSITDVGATSLAQSLRSNSTLKFLWMGECEAVTDKGGVALKDALQENSSLEQLALVCTQVGEELQADIEEMVQSQRAPAAARLVA